MAKRKRDMQLNFRVSAEELAVIEQKMSQFGTSNREAYLRKMALDGYVVKLELPELKELVSLMRRSSNNRAIYHLWCTGDAKCDHCGGGTR